ncbi:MAG: hypothetical protein KGL39_15260 [Patescibacteria group bacterium]|nr:hypothetical protein [Patescibacteria group bacterium]
MNGSAATARERVHLVVRTVTERFFYDPVRLALEFGITTADEVIEFFEEHEGSLYGDELFSSDANPQVSIELEARWDDE